MSLRALIINDALYSPSGLKKISTRSSRARLLEGKDFLKGWKGSCEGYFDFKSLYCEVRLSRHVICSYNGAQQCCRINSVQHKRCHNFRRLISPSSEVISPLRLTLSTKLVKLCGVPLFRLCTVASLWTFFRFDLSSSNADIDFVLLKLNHRINSDHPDVIHSTATH